MQLTLTVPDHYARLTNPAERAALEHELSLVLGWCRVVEMRAGNRHWRRGGNRNGKHAALTEAEVLGAACPIGGG